MSTTTIAAEITALLATKVEEISESREALSDLVTYYGVYAVAAFMDWTYGGADIDAVDEWADGFVDAFLGTFDSERAYAIEVADMSSVLSSMGDLSSYFDYDAYARDLFAGDFYYDARSGAVFASF